MQNPLHVITENLTARSALGILINIVDILLVAALFYHLLMWAKGTRAWQIMWGLVVFSIIVSLSNFMGLTTLSWILQKFVYLGPVAIVILFFPELRNVLEEMGRSAFWGRRFSFLAKEDVTHVVNMIVRAAMNMSERRIGALIVMERETGLGDHIPPERVMEATLTSDLLETIFYPGSPLHDGAVIVRGDKIVAAGCILPLSSNPGIGTSIHTRHRAALGMTELSDAVVVVVSEETGNVSLSHEGRLIRGLREEMLRERLIALLAPEEMSARQSQRPNLFRKKRTTVGTK